MLNKKGSIHPESLARIAIACVPETARQPCPAASSIQEMTAAQSSEGLKMVSPLGLGTIQSGHGT
jgi:hypothetical protein